MASESGPDPVGGAGGRAPRDPVGPWATGQAGQARQATTGQAGRGASGHGRAGAKPFVVPAAKLRRVAGTVRREHRQAPIEDLATMGSVVPEGSAVTVEVTLSSYLGGVMASGVVEAPWIGECRRCGRPVAGGVHADVRERYVDADRTDDDEEAYPLADDELDLEPLARDAVLLDLPLAPLCDEHCLGLCPQCGINRNEETCSCRQPTDPRWSALDALRDEGAGGDA